VKTITIAEFIYGDASNAKEFKANNVDDVEGSEFIQFVVHRAVHRLAHIAGQSKGTRVSA